MKQSFKVQIINFVINNLNLSIIDIPFTFNKFKTSFALREDSKNPNLAQSTKSDLV